MSNIINYKVYLEYIICRNHELLEVLIKDKKFHEKFNEMLIYFLMKVFKINFTKNHHKNFDNIFDMCITQPSLGIYMIVYLYTCTLPRNLTTFTISDNYLVKTCTDRNADKNIENNYIKVLTTFFPKFLIKQLMFRKIFLCFENLYFINLSLYYETLHSKNLSSENLCFKNLSINDFRIFFINYYLEIIKTNEMFLKIKKRFNQKQLQDTSH